MEIEESQHRLKNIKPFTNGVLRVVYVVFAWAKKDE